MAIYLDWDIFNYNIASENLQIFLHIGPFQQIISHIRWS